MAKTRSSSGTKKTATTARTVANNNERPQDEAPRDNAESESDPTDDRSEEEEEPVKKKARRRPKKPPIPKPTAARGGTTISPETRRNSGSATPPSVASLEMLVGTAGRGLHLTPTKRKKPATDTRAARRMQSKCRICNAKTIKVCSYCRVDPEIGEIRAAYCCATTDRDCFRRHMDEFH
jgi:hypothetical protein